MKITKKFSVESSHIVRDCSTERCSHSIHGHSYIIELELSGNKLDNAGMLYDFGLLKGPIKEYIDSMDHTHIYNINDDPKYIDFCIKYSDRAIGLPFNPSAEMLAIWIHAMANLIIEDTKKKNDEDPELYVSSVTVHETATGRAQTSMTDIEHYWKPRYVKDIRYSPGVVKDWSNDLYRYIGDLQHDVISSEYPFENPEPYKQIKK